MGKFSIEQPAKHRGRVKKGQEPPKPPTFIDVIECANVDVPELMKVPFGELRERAMSAALKNEPCGFTVKKVEYFKLSVAPAPGLSWLRDYRGMPSLYRQN